MAFSSLLTLSQVTEEFSNKYPCINPYRNALGDGIQKLDAFGNVTIFNVTLNKMTAAIGENVTVSTLYSLACNAGYEMEYGIIGIESFGWYESKNAIIAGMENFNVSEIISIDPNHFDANDICTGRVEIKISEILNPLNFKIYTNFSTETLEVRKARLNFTLVEQYPLTIFSQDLLNISFQVHNEHAQKYAFSDSNVTISVNNQNASLNFSRSTDSNGYLNFTINCSSLGAGNYTIQLESEETVDYDPTEALIQLEVFDEDTCVNCTLLNDGEVYARVSYDESNYTKAFYSIQCEFNAEINYTSSIGQGQCAEVDNQYFATLSAPNASGTYQIRFSARPKAAGKVIEFNESLQVKRRPIELVSNMFLDGQQFPLFFQVQVIDKLTNRSIDVKNDIAIFARYNESTQLIGTVECNLSGMASFEWQPPNAILEDYISFTFQFIASPIYQSSVLSKNVTIVKFAYMGPLQAYTARTMTITARLRALNGSPLPDQPIELIINGELFHLMTDSNGLISHSLTTPAHATNLGIELYFPGSTSILAATLMLTVEISLDALHLLWNSLGIILAGISIVTVLLIYIKKRFTKQNLAKLKVN